MLYPEAIQALPVQGNHVVIVPNRDIVIITGDEDIEGLLTLFRLTAEALEQARPMSPKPYNLINGQWSPYKPHKNSPIAPYVQELHIQSAGADYGEQAELLNVLYEQELKDIFVASFSAVQEEDTGEVMSYCVWPEEVNHELLPVTDFVMMIPGDGNNKTYQVKWEDLMREFGDEYLEDSGLYPVRYRATKFPDVEKVKQLAVEVI